MVGAFKTLSSHSLCEMDAPLDCDEFICSDSQPAKERVLEVVSQIPLLTVDRRRSLALQSLPGSHYPVGNWFEPAVTMSRDRVFKWWGYKDLRPRV